MIRQPAGEIDNHEKKNDGRRRRWRVAVDGGGVGGLGGVLVVGGAMVAVAVGAGFVRSRVFGRKKGREDGKVAKLVEEEKVESKGSIQSQDSLGATSSYELGLTPPPPASSSLGSSEDDSDGGTCTDHVETSPPNPRPGIVEAKGEVGQEEEVLVESNSPTPFVDEVSAEKEAKEQQQQEEEEEQEDDGEEDEDGGDDDGTDTEDSSSMGSVEYTKWPAEGTDYSSSSSGEEEERGTKSSFDVKTDGNGSNKEPPTTTKNRTIAEQWNNQQGMAVVVAKNSKFFLYLLHMTLALVVMVVAFLLTDRLLRKALHLFGGSTSS